MKYTVRITRDDLRNPYVTTLSNAVSLALQRVTGQPWYVFDGTAARPMRAPLERVPLPREVSRWWRAYSSSGARRVPPLQFEVELSQMPRQTAVN